MTKKRIERPSIGSTLKKKVELTKPEKEIPALEKQIKELHNTDVAQSTNKQQEVVRTTIFVPKELYKTIKIYCAHQDNVKIKDFVTEAIVEKCKNLGLME